MLVKKLVISTVKNYAICSINSAWFIGELLNLDYEGTRYTGLITANPKWKIHVEGLNPVYVTELNMAVIEEGVL